MPKEDVGSPFGRIPSEVEHSGGSETSWKEPMTGLHKDFNCWTVGSVGKTLPSCKAEADKGGQGGKKVVGLSSSKVKAETSKNGGDNGGLGTPNSLVVAVETEADVLLNGHSWYK